MLPSTKVSCFIFACSHPSSVKKLYLQNRNTFTYIRWRRFKSRITNIRLSLSFLHWKEQNEFHLSFCNGHSEFIFFTQWLEFCARLMRWQKTLTRKLKSACKKKKCQKYYIATWIKIEMLPPHAFVRGMRCLFFLNFENISVEFLSRWLRNGLQHCEPAKQLATRLSISLSVYQSISLSVYQKLALKVIISMQMSIGAKKL